MLIQCKECGESVSDKASICPHCGFPLGTKDSCDGDIHETYLRKLKMVIMRFGQYLKAGLVFRDGICPTFGMYVIQSTATIIVHLGFCTLFWLMGGAAEHYIPKPYCYIVLLPMLLIAVGYTYFWIRILLVFFPTIGRYERYIRGHGMEDDTVFKTFGLKKRLYQLYYWGFFVALIVVWLIIVHIADGGDWGWMAEGNNYRPRHRW